MGLGIGSQVNFPRRSRIARIASALAEGARVRCAMMSLFVGVALELGARQGSVRVPERLPPLECCCCTCLSPAALCGGSTFHDSEASHKSWNDASIDRGLCRGLKLCTVRVLARVACLLVGLRMGVQLHQTGHAPGIEPDWQSIDLACCPYNLVTNG